MTGLSHVLLFSTLIATGFMSAFSPMANKENTFDSAFSVLSEEVSVQTSSVVEEVHDVKKVIYKDFEKVKMYDKDSGRVVEMDLEDYVAGVLLAEMPTWYHEESLKAMSVAVRTYTVCKMNSSSHVSGADICNDPSHCQAFYTLPDAVEAWSENSAVTAFEKVESAVEETKGEVAVFEGLPILAMYHASGYLKTRSSKEVFGGELPYLQSVDIGFENEKTSTYSTKNFDKSTVAVALVSMGALKSAKDSFDICDVWQNGKCEGLEVVSNGEKTLVSPFDVRRTFSLKSANFKVLKNGEGYIFETYGYGHGVGMSQSGAHLMAEEGAGYEKILSHYYSGVEIAILK